MSNHARVRRNNVGAALLLALLALLLAACDSSAAATPTTIAPTTTVAPTLPATVAASPTTEPTLTSVPPTSTNLPPTSTSVPPTSTIEPSATAVPPSSTSTAIPPTPTQLATFTPLPTVTDQPTDTPEPTATATPRPPTSTAVPPTKTPVPPTATVELELPTATVEPTSAPTDTAEPVATEATTPESTTTPGEIATVEATATTAATPLAVTAHLIERAEPGKNMVALTFDAGAGRGRVADILETLRQYNVHITFFLTGKWAEENPDMVQAIAADGHEIANHSYSHPEFSKLSDEQMIDEITHCEALVQEIAGVTTKPYFRPPFGDYNKHVLQVVAAQGYQPIYWTLDSLDSVGQPKTKEFIIKRVTENNIEMDGAIILQHMAADGSADALPTEIERLQARGLKIVTVGELLN